MLHNMNNVLKGSVNGCENMSHVMCHDHFHVRVCVRVCIASHDMTGHGVTWNSIQLHSPGIHIQMGLTNALSHGLT